VVRLLHHLHVLEPAGGETAAPSVDIFRELATDSVEEYNVATNSWRPKARLPKNKFRCGWEYHSRPATCT